MKTIAKVILLLSMGWFLATRLLGGTLNYYIHPRFNTLTALTAVGLVIVGVAYWIYYARTNVADAEPGALFNRQRNLSWLSLLLLALPAILGSIVPPQPLGAGALGNREVGLGTLASSQTPGGSQLSTINTGGTRNIVDWLYLFQRGEPADFNGDEASVVGFVYRDERFNGETFMVSRFTVSCCVADAAPVGLIVSTPQAPELADDAWVEVTGRFAAREFNGRLMPVLIADTITPTEPPSQPYLYQ